MSFALLDAPEPRRLAPPPAGIAREISYAPSAATRPARAVIRAVEALTGRHALIRRAAGYEDDLARGQGFWRVMADRFGLRLEILAGSLEAIPREGPLVVVANHPFGILDGLVLGHVLAGARGGEFRILAHEVFARAPVLARAVLPVDFRGDAQALRTNLATRAAAFATLRAGGAVGVFPGGTVSTAARPFAVPMDPAWRAFTARLVTKSGATVVPIWFDGANSRLFQLASHVNQTLRLALLLHEFRRRLDQPVRLAIGAPIAPDEIAARARDGREVMDFLRRRTYALSPEPLDADLLGHEFEAHHKGQGRAWRSASSIRAWGG